MGTISHLPRRDRPQPSRLTSDLEVETAVEAIVSGWREEPGTSFALRRENLKLSGLSAISLTAAVGGLDCPTALIADLVGSFQHVDADAADVLHRHYVLLEHFRASDHERFYRQLAEQVQAGDLIYASGGQDGIPLAISEENLQFSADGTVALPAAALWADWLWIDARNESLSRAADGAVLLALRSATIETHAGGTADLPLHAGFRSTPVPHSVWGAEARLYRTARALDHLLEAARLLAVIGTAGDPDVRRSVARTALKALVHAAAGALDLAQVDPEEEALAEAERLTRDAVLFALDLSCDKTRFMRLAGL